MPRYKSARATLSACDPAVCIGTLRVHSFSRWQHPKTSGRNRPRTGLDYPNNNVNANPGGPSAAIAAGDVDIGPMQINYKTWVGTVQAGENADPETSLTAANVFGNQLGAGQFSGLPEANLAFDARILADLNRKYGTNAAGYYRTGDGPWSKTASGQAAFAQRQAIYNKYAGALSQYLMSDCFY